MSRPSTTIYTHSSKNTSLTTMTLLPQKFCYCGNLRTGALVAGFGGIILALCGIAAIFILPINYRTIELDWLSKEMIQTILVVNFSLAILICILLILGVFQKNMYLMVPWILLVIMVASGLLASAVYTAIEYYINGEVLNGSLFLVFGLIASVIYIYMWMVTYSFFAITKEDDIIKERTEWIELEENEKNAD